MLYCKRSLSWDTLPITIISICQDLLCSTLILGPLKSLVGKIAVMQEQPKKLQDTAQKKTAHTACSKVEQTIHEANVTKGNKLRDAEK